MIIKGGMTKIFLLLIPLLLVALTIVLTIGLVIGSSYYEDLNFNNVVLEDSVFRVNISLQSSGKTFRRYKYKINGENLYLTISSGLAMNNIGTGTLDVEIRDEKLKNVKKVYVKSGKKTKMIWKINQ